MNWGASIAQISGQYEQIYIYSREPREDSLKDAQDRAVKQTILAGALSETIELVEVEETPLAYHPENATRLKVKVVGKMKTKGRVLINRFFLLLFLVLAIQKVIV